MKKILSVVVLIYVTTLFCCKDKEDPKEQKTITFQLGVYTFNPAAENFQISSADIDVISGLGDDLAELTLDATTTEIELAEADSYTLTISKDGYIPSTRSFSLAELQNYAEQALYVRLYEESTNLNLAVYYPFSGNTNDESGHVSAGVNEGAVLGFDQYGNFNSSYSFDGFTQYINLGNILDDVTYPFTVAVWVKPGDHTGRPYNTIFTSQDNAPLYNGFDLHISNGTSIGVAIGDGRGENNGIYGKFKAATISDRTGLWTHVAAVVTSNDNMKLYLNGVEVDGSYAGSTTFPMASNFPDDVARLGRWTSNGTTYYYTGVADEFRVWKRALTPLEIKRSM